MTILERLLHHDAWTTRALLSLSANLSDADLDREFDIGHRTLRRTFSHIVGNMECWFDLMSDRPQRAAATTAPSPDSVAGLLARLDIVADELLSLGRAVSEQGRENADFVDYLDNPPHRKPLGAGLVHLATHGMHHRAQCLYILRRLGVKNLIEGDALSWERQHLGLNEWPVDAKEERRQ
ncbi:DinB family protein [Humisphaera borealis]|uniref:DinB family protein n=1 Tax=Humisphaera borealis TaxID=2807512 RepID=A0A7M2WWQ5_9BACT|nr:DinB family protein [Humisphaera borealis]QOV89833.1 DinB family protein [Humisphaera borealis]